MKRLVFRPNTSRSLRYEVPDQWIRREWRGNYRGQKQIWFLLRLTGRDSDIDLRATEHPEFDAWRWNDYWIPLESVIEFKQDVYRRAMHELARLLFGRNDPRRTPPTELWKLPDDTPMSHPVRGRQTTKAKGHGSSGEAESAEAIATEESGEQGSDADDASGS
jgi:hypothetical protein